MVLAIVSDAQDTTLVDSVNSAQIARAVFFVLVSPSSSLTLPFLLFYFKVVPSYRHYFISLFSFFIFIIVRIYFIVSLFL